MPHVVVGTAGHIDHGKTALVKAITGIDADRLKEEKERGITIDIGFAHLELDPGTTVSFIDVPGHERFIKNMLAGAGGIDLVMLVVAADESVMPQTREHLDICSLLRIRHGFTVLTKVDKVDPEIAALAEAEVRDFLKGSFLEQAPIVRVSSMTGEGIPELLSTLRRAIASAKTKDDGGIFRLPIDRCFTMKGFGTVVTGTLIAGRVRKEQEVEIFPPGRKLRIRGIQVHGHPAAEAHAGQRTALNLQGIEVAEVARGMVLAEPGMFAASSMLDCHVELLPSAPNSIEARKRIRFHTGTAEIIGYVVLLGQERLQPGAAAYAQIRLEEPILALPGDRFIIRQYSPMLTVGGGEILDAAPGKHRPMDRAVIDRLRVFKEGTAADKILQVIEDAGGNTVELNTIAGARGIPVSRVREHVELLANTGRIRLLAENRAVAVSSRTFEALGIAVSEFVQRFHAANPLAAGIAREEVKNRLFADSPPLLFEGVMESLVAARKVAFAQDLVMEFGRTVTLKPDEERMRSRLAEQFRAFALQAPVADEVIDALKLDRIVARKILQMMVKQNELVKISEALFVDRAAMDKLIGDVRALKASKSSLGVGDFKVLTGVTRKHAIPLLEYLDRQRITRRVGEDRVIL